MPSPTPEAPAPPRKSPPAKRTGCLRRLVIPAIIAVAFVGWLDARGAAMLARYVLLRQAAAAGLSGEVEVTGFLRDGLEITRVRLDGSGRVQQIDGAGLRARWHWREIFSGKLQAVESDRLRVVVDLSAPHSGRSPADAASTNNASPDDSQSASGGGPDWQSFRALWESRVHPIAIHLRDLQVEVRSGTRPLGQLGPTTLVHEAGENQITIEMGEVTGPAGPPIAAQTIALRIGGDALTVDSLTVPGGWSIGPMAMRPESGQWTASARHGDALLEISSDGPSSALRARLTSGTLDVPSMARPWLAWPEDAALTIDALDLTCGDWHRAPVDWEVNAGLGVPSLAWREWSAKALRAKARYRSGHADATIEATVENAPMTLQADVDFAPGGFAAGKTKARVGFPSIGPAIAAVRSRYFPAAAGQPTLDGAWDITGSMAWGGESWSALIVEADGSGLRAGTRALPNTAITLRWPDAPSPIALTAAQSGRPEESWTAGGNWEPRAGRYAASFATAATWDPAPVLAAAALFGFAPPVEIPPLGMNWKGEGDARTGNHSGHLDLHVPEITMGPRPNASARLAGEYRWPGSFKLASLALRDGPVEKEDRIDLRLDWHDSLLRVDGLTVMAGGVALGGGHVSLPWTPDVRSLGQWMDLPGSLDADIRVDRHPMAIWERWLPEARRPGLSGEMGATLRLAGTPARPEVNLEVLANGLKHPAMGEAPPGNLALRLANTTDNALELTADLQHSGIEPVHARLRIPVDPMGLVREPGAAGRLPISGTARMGSLEIGRYATMVPALREMSGRLDAELDIAGTIARPQLKGRATLANGKLAPVNPSVGKIEGIALDVSFDGEAMRITRGEARLGGGILDLTGQAGRLPDGRTQAAFRLTGDHLLLWRDASVLVRASPDLTLTGGDGRWKLAGDIPLVECLYLRDFELIPLGTAFTVPKAPSLPHFNPPQPSAAAGEKLSVLDLDVGIAFRDPMLIRGNVARGQVSGSVRVTGTAAAPVANGSAILNDGVARLPFSILRVPRGEVVFLPGRGLIPELRIEGRSKLPPYEVTVRVGGPADNPAIHLISEPPLPNNEILALLATGSTTDALEDPSNAQAKALQLLASQLRGGRLPFGRRIAELLGPLENVQVQIGQESPFDGRARTGVVVELSDRFLLTGAVDAEDNQRLTLTFLLRFR